MAVLFISVNSCYSVFLQGMYNAFEWKRKLQWVGWGPQRECSGSRTMKSAQHG